jgi:streptogramin lyase
LNDRGEFVGENGGKAFIATPLTAAAQRDNPATDGMPPPEAHGFPTTAIAQANSPLWLMNISLVECEGPKHCGGLWVFRDTVKGVGGWDTGARATLKILQISDDGRVVIERSDMSGSTIGLTAIYRGVLKNHVIQGNVEWSWPGHWPKPAQGLWFAAATEAELQPVLAAHLPKTVPNCLEAAAKAAAVSTDSLLATRLAPDTITTIYGDGTATFRDAAGPAMGTSIGNVNAMAVDQRGNLYLQQASPNLISKVDAQTGNTCLITGRGAKDAIHSPDPGRASDFSIIGLPQGGTLAVGQSGSLYFIDDNGVGSQEIRQVDLNTGSIRTLPLETGAKLWNSWKANSLVADSSSLFLAAGCANCAWKLDINTGDAHWLVRGGLGAGSGGHTPDSFSDGRLKMDFQDNVFILEKSSTLLRLSQDGHAVKIAGNGKMGESHGDGGPATAAAIDVTDFVIDRRGNIYLSEADFNCIRRIDANTSIIRTVVGTCVYREKGAGFSGDGGRPSDAKLNAPAYLAFDAEENLIFVDWGNHRVRKVVWGSVR